jgi:drug/metabolite transporter (DMT)-like permease
MPKRNAPSVIGSVAPTTKRVTPTTSRKSGGVVLATIGVAIALLTNLGTAPAGAWRGDLLMVAAAFCMAFYSVWSRPLTLAYGTIVYTTLAMATGGLAGHTYGLRRLSGTEVAMTDEETAARDALKAEF